jgi:FkbM family methyltransferase
LVSRTGIPKKIHINNKSLGHWIYALFTHVLYFKLPDPIEIHGMLMYHRPEDKRPWTGWTYAFNYEPKTRQVFQQISKPGMTVVDVGANIGYYTLLAAKCLGNNGRVYAFEPDPSFYNLLKKNIEANGLSGFVGAYNFAVSNREERADLFLGRCVETSLFNILNVSCTRENIVSVDVVSLDKFFSRMNWPPVHVVKIDTEGADKFCLEGMRELINRNKDIKIIVELAPHYLEPAGTSAQDLLHLLVELGFKKVQALFSQRLTLDISPNIEHLVHLARENGHINLLCEKST